MKKAILVVSISALMLSMAGVASADPVNQTKDAVSPISSVSEGKMIVTFVYAEGMQTMDQGVELKGLGSTYNMKNGSNWLLYSGSNVIRLSGSLATSIGYGSAKVAAYKGNGELLGWYNFEVIR